MFNVSVSPETPPTSSTYTALVLAYLRMLLTRSSAHLLLFPFISFFYIVPAIFYIVPEIKSYIIWSLHHECSPKLANNARLSTVNPAHTTAAINYCILTSCLATKKVNFGTIYPNRTEHH